MELPPEEDEPVDGGTGVGGGRRGKLRVYLGAAPGVGKTVAMVSEGRRRVERGQDVVVAFVETHGRTHTAAALDGLEQVPRRRVVYPTSPGAVPTTLEEMDVDAVLARAPRHALVDELAHTNAPGSRNAKRWEDVEELLAAGIDVITTVNVQHLESLNDVVAQITGVRQRETVPDDVVRSADAIELVDMSPQALRRRLAHGNVYAAERVDAALANYFRVGNLTALRELALLWTADRVDAALALYRAEQGIAAPWGARERVVVTLTGGPEGDALVRRAARITQRAAGGELLALHVSRSDGLTGAAPDALARQRLLAESLGGSWHSVVGEDVATAILDFARGVNATHIVVGASRRSRLAAALSPGVGQRVIDGSGDIDVHVVTHASARGRHGRLERRSALSALPVRRRAAGWALATGGPVALTGLLHLTRVNHELPSELLLFLALVVGVALVGGMWPALLAAVLSGLLANWYFTPPYGTLTIASPANAVALFVLVSVGAAVAAVVDTAARRAREAARARAEADVLATLAGSVLRGAEAVPALLDRLVETFGLRGAALLERTQDSPGTAHDLWRVVASQGCPPPSSPDAADAALPVDEHLSIAITSQGDDHRGRSPLSASDLRVLTAVATQAGSLLERDRLREAARAARREEERTATRTALLAAVSHDLRTPLASVKASASTLRAFGAELDAADRDVLLADVETSADRLQALVDNLLDMSRLDAGAVRARVEAVALDEVVPRALAGLTPEQAAAVVLDVPEDLPLVDADAGLLERALGNVVENALRHAVPHAPGQPVEISAGLVEDSAAPGGRGGRRVVVRVVDRGPGIPDERKAAAFSAFQRLGDAPGGLGVGLGLAVARGLVEASGGTVEADDTPGGGLTVVFSLPAAVVSAQEVTA
ncbi:two-component system, OmpR family, sensor histidine kinase KdpD [Quadrisphaera granulorum]|uniref:histidine kinase n=1 Tax=Quadrisphaera granulorum TaxID=317664 RepID=A0A316A4P0_9ACTN|nr:two-component system sensor histidine kinase KdpD [Quadrisphaera granulorum]SZE97721.1 two-component system, OmpR family, sensor histidine kinase KdpD [Quadrisphaera granulorum]